MPEKRIVEKAKEDLREGKSPTTAAGEFVHEEMDHIREGKHGARSTKQAIAIGLSKARRAGIPLKPQKKGASRRSRRSEQRAYEVGQKKRKPRSPSKRRSRATSRALKREGHRAASRKSLSRQARSAAARRGRSARSASAKRGQRTRSHSRSRSRR
jgi:hypothetical protein